MHTRGLTAGFTMIEVMVAVAIFAILLGLAAPSFQDSMLNSQLRASSTELLASASLARTEAIKRNAPVNVCVSTDGATCAAGGWHQGWIVMVPSSATVVQRYEAAPGNFRISASSGTSTVTFQPTGVGATPVTLTICKATPSPGRQERIVTIDAAGRASSRKTTTGTCS